MADLVETFAYGDVVHVARSRVAGNDRTSYVSACNKTFLRTRAVATGLEIEPDYGVPTCVFCVSGDTKRCVKCRDVIRTPCLHPDEPERCVRCADYDSADPDHREYPNGP